MEIYLKEREMKIDIKRYYKLCTMKEKKWKDGRIIIKEIKNKTNK